MNRGKITILPNHFNSVRQEPYTNEMFLRMNGFQIARHLEHWESLDATDLDQDNLAKFRFFLSDAYNLNREQREKNKKIVN